MFCSTLFVILFVVLKFCTCFTVFTEKVAKIDRFEGICDRQENLPMTFHNLSFTHIKRTVTISGILIVKKNLDHQIEQILDLTRCRNRESLDSCENYNKIRFTKCCDLLNAEGQLWTPFVKSIKPRIRCPVKAGVYTLDNGKFDINLALFPIDGWYWRAHVKSYDTVTKEQLLCMKVEAEVQVVRKQ